MRKILSVLILIFLVSCSTNVPTEINLDNVETIELGEGENSFYFHVIYEDATPIFRWKINTDETTVGAALVSHNLVSGTESSLGLLVTTVNGIEATGSSWWMFCIDGEMAMTGLAESGGGATEIEQGREYSLVYTE